MLDEHIDPRDSPVYIGTTLFKKANIARLKPLAEARNGRWIPVTDQVRQFPEEGSVFSLDPRVLGKDEGYVVLFTMTINDRFQPGSGKDKYITATVCEPYEILKTLVTIPADRRLAYLTGEGFKRGLQVNDRVVLSLPGKRCVMPLVSRLQPDRWGLSHAQDLTRIPVYEEPEGLDGGMKIAGRWFAPPGRVPDTIVGALNWQSDTEFLETLLKFLKRTAPLQPGSDLGELSRTVQERLHAVYRSAGIIFEDPAENAAIFDRLGSFLRRLDQQTLIAEQVARDLYDNPSVRAALLTLSDDERRRIHEAVVAEAEAAAKVEVDEEVAEARAVARLVLEEIEQLGARRSALETEIEGLLALRQSEVSSMAATLEKVRSTFAGFSGDVRYILDAARAFGVTLPLDEAPTKVPAPDRAVVGAPWARKATREAEAIPLDGLKTVATSTARGAGLRIEDIRALDVLARGGEVPVLRGPASETLLEVYADTVAAGDLRRFPLEPTILSADDLWTHPSRPGPTTFASAWEDAESDPGALTILCLDDLDAASLTGWFPRFRHLFRAARPRNLLVVATLSERATGNAPKDPTAAPGPAVECEYVKGAALATLAGIGRPRSSTWLAAPHAQVLEVLEIERLKELVAGREGLCASRILDLASVCASARSWVEIDEAFTLACELMDGDDEAAGRVCET